MEEKNKLLLPRKTPNYFILGISCAMSLIFMMLAMGTAQGAVGYVIAIKRTSVLFSIVSGALFFKEKVSIYLFIGALLIIIGSVIWL